MHSLEQLKSGQLDGLKRLNLAENLREFPTEIYQLADSLEILDLSNNLLSELPTDFHRLTRLKVLFLSNNQFKTVPTVLAKCPALEMIGFKSNHIETLPEDALPLQTRWLILTDNQLSQLPESLGKLSRLEKLMLAGNRLTSLPQSLKDCHRLALMRISANQLTELPDWLIEHPTLAWLAFSGNPICESASKHSVNNALPHMDFSEVACQEILGQGASGVIYRAQWQKPAQRHPKLPETFALKIFKGQVTSDGYPQDELNTSIQVGQHPHLVQILAQVSSSEKRGIMMALIPDNYQNLGQPPSLETCTRDTFAEGLCFELSKIRQILQAVTSSLMHLHAQSICHGDLYAHNILIDENAHILFGDFGAASQYHTLPPKQQQAVQTFEVRAFGHLMDDLLGLCQADQTLTSTFTELNQIAQQCTHAKSSDDLSFKHIHQQLNAL